MEWTDLRNIALAHYVYHALKLGHDSILGSSHAYHRWGAVLDLAAEAAAIAKVYLFDCSGGVGLFAVAPTNMYTQEEKSSSQTVIDESTIPLHFVGE